MGGQLKQTQKEIPEFVVWATRDPKSAPLQRVQIIKGWTSDTGLREKVYDVACASGEPVGPPAYQCPDVAPSVSLEDCSWDQNAGSSELKTLWQDPDFKHEEQAFYYARDALRSNVRPRTDQDRTIKPLSGVIPAGDKEMLIQERACSSPIWYQPHSMN